jgi:RNA polymerase sigma factor (sigma-70 family)
MDRLVGLDQTTSTPARLPTMPEGFEALFAQQSGRLVRLGFLLTDSLPLAEEVVQEAFVGLLQNWTHVTDPGAYLRTTVINRARNQLSRRGVARRGLTKLVAAAELAVTPPDPDGPVIDSLARLPGRQRAAVVMRYWADWSENDIATALNCRPGTVKSLLARALEQLRKDASTWT